MTTPLSIPSAAGGMGQNRDDANSLGLRIGTVTSYSMGTAQVQVSGSNALAAASYPINYVPLVGDSVVLLRNGTNWMIVSANSVIPGDNQVLNPSFEVDGVGTAIPSSWNSSNAVGSATTSVVLQPWATMDSDGPQCYSVTGSNVENELSSAPVVVSPGQTWAATAKVAGFSANLSVVPQATLFISSYNQAGDTYPNTSAADSTHMVVPAISAPTWLRLGTGGVNIPTTGVSAIRVTLRTNIPTNTNAPIVYWDRVVLRQLA